MRWSFQSESTSGVFIVFEVAHDRLAELALALLVALVHQFRQVLAELLPVHISERLDGEIGLYPEKPRQFEVYLFRGSNPRRMFCPGSSHPRSSPGGPRSCPGWPAWVFARESFAGAWR